MSDASPPLPDVVPHEIQEAGRRLRNAYTFIVTGVCLAGIILLSWVKPGGGVDHAIDTLGGICETVVLAYMTTSLADRTGILTSLASRFRFGPNTQ